MYTVFCEVFVQNFHHVLVCLPFFSFISDVFYILHKSPLLHIQFTNMFSYYVVYVFYLINHVFLRVLTHNLHTTKFILLKYTSQFFSPPYIDRVGKTLGLSNFRGAEIFNFGVQLITYFSLHG